ncbi:hypothetical protein [Fusobacterium sp. SB021]
MPVIAGTGSNNTKHAVWLSQEAEKTWSRCSSCSNSLL